MTASTASDASGVEYFFDETSGNPGGTDSGWQDSPTYSDIGLEPNTEYTYTVTARDKATVPNTTAASSPASATTENIDNIPPTPNPMTFAVAPIAASSSAITMTATTASDLSGVEYFFDETSGNPGGTDSGWQDSPVYTDSGLTPGLQYSYTVRSRDKSILYNTGIPSAPAYATTVATTAAYEIWAEGSAFEDDDNGDGLANGLAWFLGAAHSAENAVPRLPTFDNAADPDYFIFTHRRNDSAAAAGAIGTVRYGSDLDGWTTAVHDGNNVIIQVSDESPDDIVEVKIRRSLATGGRLFARLEVLFTAP
jgi:hypothetical protein